ncbi:MAG: PQQ-binding-like beta-propeller repeat protein [Candidatus Doudnabacteria bacterium]|nr:PQQ-binding-like beta-propeller repeat protein [Candidatus Doudnabacteria bacterium]
MDPNEARLKKIIEDEVFTTKFQQKIISPSGGEDAWLLDFRSVLLQPEVLNLICEIFFQKMDGEYPFQVGGMESASIPFITALVLNSNRRGRPVNGFYIRKSRKREGLMKIVEGKLTDDKVILVDDLINSGKSFIKQVEVMESLGKKVAAVFVLMRFSALPRYEYFHKKGIKIISILGMDDLQDCFKVFPKQTTAAIPKYVPFAVNWGFVSKNPSYHHVVPKSVPVLDDDKLYFGSDNGNFWALNQRDGSIAWKMPVGKVAGKSVFSSPVIHNGVVYFGAYDGNLYALRTDSGIPAWIFMEADWIGSSPALAPEINLLFVGTEHALQGKRGGIVALDMATGQKRWHYAMPEYTHGSPAYIPWLKQVIIGSNDGCVYLFNAADGKLIWKLQTGSDVKAGFALDESRNLAAFGSFDGCCYVVNLADGKVLHKFSSQAIVYSTPLIYGENVFFASADKTLYSYNLNSGQLNWSFKTAGRIFSSPTIIDGRLYIGSNDGRLYELDIAIGREIGFHQFVERITNKIVYNDKTKRFFVPTFANEIFCLSKPAAEITKK